MSQLRLSIPGDHLAALDAAAKARGISREQAALDLLVAGLKTEKKVTKKEVSDG